MGKPLLAVGRDTFRHDRRISISIRLEFLLKLIFIAKKIDPKMKDDEKEDLAMCVFSIGAFLDSADPALWKRFQALGKAMKK